MPKIWAIDFGTILITIGLRTIYHSIDLNFILLITHWNNVCHFTRYSYWFWIKIHEAPDVHIKLHWMIFAITDRIRNHTRTLILKKTITSCRNKVKRIKTIHILYSPFHIDLIFYRYLQSFIAFQSTEFMNYPRIKNRYTKMIIQNRSYMSFNLKKKRRNNIRVVMYNVYTPHYCKYINLISKEIFIAHS